MVIFNFLNYTLFCQSTEKRKEPQNDESVISEEILENAIMAMP